MNLKGSFAVLELPMVLLLFSTTIFYFGVLDQVEGVDYKFTGESLLNAIYYDDNLREVVIMENLSNSSITSNWTNITNILDLELLNYELVVSNNTVSKNIVSCNSTYEKYFHEIIVSIYNNSNYEFRKLKLGVCY